MTRFRLVALALVFMLLPAADAAAQSGGAPVPKGMTPKTVSCAGVTACSAPKTVVRGKNLVLSGGNMSTVRRVLFAGQPGRRDDVVSAVTNISARSATAVVPRKARSGPVTLQNARRAALGKLPAVTVRASAQGEDLDTGSGTAFYYASRRRPTYTFTVAQPAQVVVELISDETQTAVASWTVAGQPGVPSRVTWNGNTPAGVAATGRYRFRLASGPATPTPEATTAFFFGDHFFPIRGRHDLGQSPTNSFGGGGQRSHMGQDMFARCGTTLAAARGGKVRFAGYQGAAGNYVVIDGSGTNSPDYAYMHMREPALVSTGDRVSTGQHIGDVGETGRATGCHLHFEMWSAPGWYVGGKAFDPLPSLEDWDAFS